MGPSALKESWSCYGGMDQRSHTTARTAHQSLIPSDPRSPSAIDGQIHPETKAQDMLVDHLVRYVVSDMVFDAEAKLRFWLY